MKPNDHPQRLDRATRSLDGLSVGDAFGERFFGTPGVVEQLIEQRALPAEPWRITDDSMMALSIVEVLAEHGELCRDSLAELFGRRYRADPTRGYGATAHGILEAIGHGNHWSDVSPRVYAGTGSMGNGGAMRVAPLGAYFADDDPSHVAEQARRSAEVTHAHPEGQAGAVAIALASAWAARGGGEPSAMFATVLAHTLESETRRGIERAAALPFATDVREAAARLGNGSRVIAPDTVPFTLWCAARHLDDYEEAMWQTVSGLGDRDTTCAIVGGIVSASPNTGPPATWLAAREPLHDL
jgi:ADP-ribosylglycohydrolase